MGFSICHNGILSDVTKHTFIHYWCTENDISVVSELSQSKWDRGGHICRWTTLFRPGGAPILISGKTGLLENQELKIIKH